MGDEHIDNKLEEQNCATLVKLFSAYTPKTKQSESDSNYNMAYASITPLGRIYVSKDTQPGDYPIAFNITDGCSLNVLLGIPGILQAQKPVRIEQSKAPDYIKDILQKAFETAKKQSKNKTEVLGKKYIRRNGNSPKPETQKKGLVGKIMNWLGRE